MRTPPAPRPPGPDGRRPGGRTVVLRLDSAGIYHLSDGRALLNPQPVGANEVKIGCWLLHRGRPHEVSNMTWRNGGGRILHLHGTPEVLSVPWSGTVHRFTVLDTRSVGRRPR